MEPSTAPPFVRVALGTTGVPLCYEPRRRSGRCSDLAPVAHRAALVCDDRHLDGGASIRHDAAACPGPAQATGPAHGHRPDHQGMGGDAQAPGHSGREAEPGLDGRAGRTIASETVPSQAHGTLPDTQLPPTQDLLGAVGTAPTLCVHVVCSSEAHGLPTAVDGHPSTASSGHSRGRARLVCRPQRRRSDHDLSCLHWPLPPYDHPVEYFQAPALWPREGDEGDLPRTGDRFDTNCSKCAHGCRVVLGHLWRLQLGPDSHLPLSEAVAAKAQADGRPFVFTPSSRRTA